jgi:hypothetical protein
MKNLPPLGQSPLYPHQRKAFDSLVLCGGMLIISDAVDGRRMVIHCALVRAGYCKRQRIGGTDENPTVLFYI